VSEQAIFYDTARFLLDFEVSAPGVNLEDATLGRKIGHRELNFSIDSTCSHTSVLLDRS
jgi:hypothetical protein